MKHEEDIELLEAYMRGTLDGEALAAFQKRRSDDPEFDRAVIDYIQIINQIKTSGEKEFLNKVKHWDREIENRARSKVISFPRMLSIAASLLVFTLAGVYIFRNSSSHQQLFDEYFQPYEDVISERSGRNDHQQRAMELYNQKNYDAAIPELDSAIMESPDNASLKCYLGIAHLAEGHTQEAKTIFKPLVSGESTLFGEIAEWNLAMAYLKLGDEKSLKKMLDGIIRQKDHQYHHQAEDLLKKL